MIIVLFLSAALAEGTVYYHPNEVAAKSKLFVEVSKKSIKKFEEVQDNLRKISGSLQEFELALYLSEDKATNTRYKQRKKEIETAFLGISNHSDSIQDQFSNAFQKAVDKALKKVAAKKTIKICTKRASMLRNKNKCQGTDINAAIAKSIDTNAKLKSQLNTILNKKWPTITFQKEKRKPIAISGTENHIHITKIAKQYLPEKIARIRQVYKKTLKQIGNKDKEKITSLHQQYRKAFQEQNTILLKAIKIAAKKKQKRGQTLGIDIHMHTTQAIWRL